MVISIYLQILYDILHTVQWYSCLKLTDSSQLPEYFYKFAQRSQSYVIIVYSFMPLFRWWHLKEAGSKVLMTFCQLLIFQPAVRFCHYYKLYVI